MNYNISRALKKMSKKKLKWQPIKELHMKIFKKKCKIKKKLKTKKWMLSTHNFFLLKSKRKLKNKENYRKRKIKKESLPCN
jgi:hypothetical protein